MVLAHAGHGVELAVTIVAPAFIALVVGAAAWRRAELSTQPVETDREQP